MVRRAINIRWSLRTALLGFTILVILLGTHTHRAHEQHRLRDAILSGGGYPIPSWQFADPSERLISANNWVDNPNVPGPSWLRDTIGREHFETIVEGYFANSVGDDVFTHFLEAVEARRVS